MIEQNWMEFFRLMVIDNLKGLVDEVGVSKPENDGFTLKILYRKGEASRVAGILVMREEVVSIDRGRGLLDHIENTIRYDLGREAA